MQIDKINKEKYARSIRHLVPAGCNKVEKLGRDKGVEFTPIIHATLCYSVAIAKLLLRGHQ